MDRRYEGLRRVEEAGDGEDVLFLYDVSEVRRVLREELRCDIGEGLMRAVLDTD